MRRRGSGDGHLERRPVVGHPRARRPARPRDDLHGGRYHCGDRSGGQRRSLLRSTTTFTTWTVPGAPTDVGATPGNQSASVTWTEPLDDGGTPIVGFDVSVYDEFGVLIDGLGGTAGPADTSFEVTGLDNGTPYQFAVAAVNSAGSGPLSGFAGPVTPVSAPDAPTDVTAIPVDVQTAGSTRGRDRVVDGSGRQRFADHRLHRSIWRGQRHWLHHDDETTCDVTGLARWCRLDFNVRPPMPLVKVLPRPTCSPRRGRCRGPAVAGGESLATRVLMFRGLRRRSTAATTSRPTRWPCSTVPAFKWNSMGAPPPLRRSECTVDGLDQR